MLQSSPETASNSDIVRWPNVLPAGFEYPHPAATFGLSASIIRAAGIAQSPRRGLDGVDILQHVARKEPPPARMLFWRGRRGQRTWLAVRDGALKLVARVDGTRREEFLFDLERDPGEQANLLANQRSDCERLRAALVAWEAAVAPKR